jgi:hypothetical protein
MKIFPLNVMNIIIGSFTIFFAFIYIKSKSIQPVPRYFNLFFCFIIILNNFLRLFHPEVTDMDNITLSCKIQGFILSFLDKLFLTSITIYSLLISIPMIKPQFYKKKLKWIYLTLTLLNVAMSLGLTILFFWNGMSNCIINDKIFCYINTSNKYKIIFDSIYTSILFIIDLICIFTILIQIYSSIRACDKNNKNKRKNLFKHFLRFLCALFLNVLTFGFLFLIIHKIINEYIQSLKKFKDLIFIIICFLDELFFTINMEFLREIVRVITCNKFKKLRPIEELYPSGTDDSFSEFNEDESENENSSLL